MPRLMRWFSGWPLRYLHRLGALLGWLTWLFSASYRRRVRANAELAGVPAAQQRQAIAEAGRMVAEVPWLWLMPAGRELGPLVRWEGAEVLERAIEAGRGTLMFTPHLGSFEVAARAIVERFGARQPLTVLYRPARKAWLREFEEQSRARPGMATAPASLAGVRQMLRALRRGEMVGLLPDQVPPHGQGVWAPLFGQPAYTMTLAAKLVQQTGATPVMLWCERLPRGEGFVMHVEQWGEALPPAEEAGKAGGEAQEAAQVAAAAVINRALERVIAAAPAQYLWGYHRYKRPRQPQPGQPAE
ncbi:MAG TPA: lysophospholipid acyltransferase family protein [Ideonella sp.]|nr:lysophospholipid acyltransferase family protein [Ideonella sp.]